MTSAFHRVLSTLVFVFMASSFATAYGDDTLFDPVMLSTDSPGERAWQKSLQQLVQPHTDRSEIAVQLRNLLNEHPTLGTEENRYLLQCLDQTLTPRNVQPGTVKAAANGLVELKQYGCSCLLDESGQIDPRYAELARYGFEAVPTLIKHLDDERLTRVKVPRFNNCHPFIMRVQDVVGAYLQELAGSELRENELQICASYAVAKMDAAAWWKKASKEGEESYLVNHVIPLDEDSEWPNSLHLWLIAKRYPKHLPQIYRKLLDNRPHMQSWPVVVALRESSLTRQEKLTLLVHAAERENLEHRRAAFWLMKDIDHAQFVKLLIRTLNELPTTPDGEYWNCREASFANLVMETDAPEAWQTLKEVADRTDVGLRMQLMNPMNYRYIGDRNRKQRIEFLASFLDDQSVRDARDNPKFSGPCAGFMFPVLEVRNLAARKLASFFKAEISMKPNADWKPEAWAEYRYSVRKALAAQ
ncbi:hypothetical protein GC176_08950 [bacterium]|nr:hypothetical protein [bacterium]